ncbi:hypothetical protein RB200_22155 [Streptomyces sp. PmtG]
MKALSDPVIAIVQPLGSSARRCRAPPFLTALVPFLTALVPLVPLMPLMPLMPFMPLLTAPLPRLPHDLLACRSAGVPPTR